MKTWISTTIVLAIFLSGCMPQVATYVMNIDGIVDVEAPKVKKFFLFPGYADISPTDLHFKEYCGYIRTVLQEKGLQSVPLEEAEIVIAVQYGIGPPQTQSYSYSVPIVGRTDAGALNVTATTTNSDGSSSSTYATITPKKRYGVVGAQTYSGTSTTFVRHLILTAIDFEAFRSDSLARTVWSTTIVSEGSSNDLRLIMPALVAASSKYIGANTGRAIEVSIRENDPAIRRLQPQSTGRQ